MPNYTGLRTDPHRQRIIEGLRRLRAQLDTEVGVRSRDKTLRLASWNIREFDSAKYGDRTSDAYYYLAEVISRFDLVAIQEVRPDLKALRQLARHLGSSWDYLVTDVTAGTKGNQERLAFLYDSGKVRFTGLAGEIVLPDVRSGGVVTPASQIARTPFVASFRSGWVSFQLATVHIIYGPDQAVPPERLAEIKAVATFLADRAANEPGATPNCVLLGDFNIYARSDATLTAITEAGWVIPKPLQSIPGSNVNKDKYYDQIAVLSRAHQFHPAGPAGVVDIYASVFRREDEDLYRPDMGPGYDTTKAGTPRDQGAKKRYYGDWRTYQLSDHLPMWIDLKIDYTDEYLDGLAPPPGPDPDGGQVLPPPP